MKSLKLFSAIALSPVLLASFSAYAGSSAYQQLKGSAADAAPAAPAPSFDGAKSIYGENSMHEYYQVSEPLKKLADSSVAFVGKGSLYFDPAAKVYRPKSALKVSETDYLAEDEDFSSQSRLSGCSGSYLGKGLVMTAGHCVADDPKDSKHFENFFLVFGWKYDAAGNPSQEFPPDSVYTIKKVETRAFEGQNDQKPYRDFALVSLDREPAGRQPLLLETEQAPRVGQKVFTIGYPLGLAVKINDPEQAQVYTLEKNTFQTNIDAFGGNSGGPAFDSATNKIVGIVVTAVGPEFYYELTRDFSFVAEFTLPVDNIEFKPLLGTMAMGAPVRTQALDLFRKYGASIAILDENKCLVTMPKGLRLQNREPIFGWVTKLAGNGVFNRGRLMRDKQDSYGTGVMRLPDEIKNFFKP